MIAKEIVDIAKRMYEKNYIVAHDGNISLLSNDNIVYITPTGLSKGFIDENQIAKIKLDGTVLENLPSSEYKMHLAVYKNNKNVRAVVHSHPIYATVFACMGISLDSDILAEAKFQLGDIPIAKYAPPGTDAAASSIIPYCKQYNGVLLEKHGLVTWGSSLTEAYFRTEIAEFLAKVLYKSRRYNK